MLALDTNVLLRYVLDDDARQSALATAVIHRASAGDESLFLSDIVVCEAVWVLSKGYKFTREEIVVLLRDLFRARHIEFRATDELSRALDAYESGKGDFTDYLIREHARAAACENVVTFDKVLLKERGFIAAK